MPFHATMLLADSAQALDNKLYVLGGGWSILNSPIPTAIALLIKVPWDQTNFKHTVTLDLVDADGNAVELAGPLGTQPVVIQNEMEVGRPPGIPHGTPIEVALAINLGPLPLSAGRYEWRLTIGDESHEDWRLPFTVMPSAQLPQPPGQA